MKTLIFAIVMLIHFPANAATVEFHLLPPGHDGQVQGVGRARYYLLEEYLELAAFDSELVAARSQLKAYDGLEKSYVAQLDAQAAIIATLEDDKKVLANDKTRIEAQWHRCEEDLLVQATPIWPYIFAAVGVGFGLVGLSYGIAK